MQRLRWVNRWTIQGRGQSNWIYHFDSPVDPACLAGPSATYKYFNLLNDLPNLSGNTWGEPSHSFRSSSLSVLRILKMRLHVSVFLFPTHPPHNSVEEATNLGFNIQRSSAHIPIGLSSPEDCSWVSFQIFSPRHKYRSLLTLIWQSRRNDSRRNKFPIVLDPNKNKRELYSISILGCGPWWQKLLREGWDLSAPGYAVDHFHHRLVLICHSLTHIRPNCLSILCSIWTAVPNSY